MEAKETLSQPKEEQNQTLKDQKTSIDRVPKEIDSDPEKPYTYTFEELKNQAIRYDLATSDGKDGSRILTTEGFELFTKCLEHMYQEVECGGIDVTNASFMKASSIDQYEEDIGTPYADQRSRNTLEKLIRKEIKENPNLPFTLLAKAKEPWSFKRRDYIYLLELLQQRSHLSTPEKQKLMSLCANMYRARLSKENITIYDCQFWYKENIQDSIDWQFENFISEQFKDLFKPAEPEKPKDDHKEKKSNDNDKEEKNKKELPKELPPESKLHLRKLFLKFVQENDFTVNSYAKGLLTQKSFRDLIVSSYRTDLPPIYESDPIKLNFYAYFLRYLCNLYKDNILNDQQKEQLLSLLEHTYAVLNIPRIDKRNFEESAHNKVFNSSVMTDFNETYEKLLLPKKNKDSESKGGENEDTVLINAKESLLSVYPPVWDHRNFLYLKYLLQNYLTLTEPERQVLQVRCVKMYTDDVTRIDNYRWYDFERDAPRRYGGSPSKGWFQGELEKITPLYDQFLIARHSSEDCNLNEMREQVKKPPNFCLTDQQKAQLVAFALSSKFAALDSDVRQQLKRVIRRNIYKDFQEGYSLVRSLVYSSKPWKPYKWSWLSLLNPATYLRLIPLAFGCGSIFCAYSKHPISKRISQFFFGVSMFCFSPGNLRQGSSALTNKPYWSFFGVGVVSTACWSALVSAVGIAVFNHFNMTGMTDLFNKIPVLPEHFSHFSDVISGHLPHLSAASTNAMLILITFGFTATMLNLVISAISGREVQKKNEPKSPSTAKTDPRSDIEHTQDAKLTASNEHQNKLQSSKTKSENQVNLNDPKFAFGRQLEKQPPPGESKKKEETSNTHISNALKKALPESEGSHSNKNNTDRTHPKTDMKLRKNISPISTPTKNQDKHPVSKSSPSPSATFRKKQQNSNSTNPPESGIIKGVVKGLTAIFYSVSPKKEQTQSLLKPGIPNSSNPAPKTSTIPTPFGNGGKK